ncbi:hypothetical protein ACIHDR_20690 [Nocardia sp. NPDC052278]|uniref:hypothetical protein n=1 Tax=unclassified Nocardia TaxID=2637762 RepID=UPI003675C372
MIQTTFELPGRDSSSWRFRAVSAAHAAQPKFVAGVGRSAARRRARGGDAATAFGAAVQGALTGALRGTVIGLLVGATAPDAVPQVLP